LGPEKCEWVCTDVDCAIEYAGVEWSFEYEWVCTDIDWSIEYTNINCFCSSFECGWVCSDIDCFCGSFEYCLFCTRICLFTHELYSCRRPCHSTTASSITPSSSSETPHTTFIAHRYSVDYRGYYGFESQWIASDAGFTYCSSGAG